MLGSGGHQEMQRVCVCPQQVPDLARWVRSLSRAAKASAASRGEKTGFESRTIPCGPAFAPRKSCVNEPASPQPARALVRKHGWHSKSPKVGRPSMCVLGDETILIELSSTLYDKEGPPEFPELPLSETAPLSCCE